MGKAITVILEGTELVGKSSVARMLADKYNCPLNKRVRTKDPISLVAEVMADIQSARARNSTGLGPKIVIFDRWQGVSDVIYQPMYAHVHSVLCPLTEVMTEAMEAAEMYIIILTASDIELCSRYEKRGDPWVKEGEVLELKRGYDSYVDEVNNANIRVVDTTGITTEEVVNKIVELLNLDSIGGSN